MKRREISISNLIGQTIVRIEDNSTFHLDNGQIVEMRHDQDCCESVGIDSIEGDINDLLNSPILRAFEICEEPHSQAGRKYDDSSHSWTCYHLATEKGYVMINWLGESNGYYSESVSVYLYEKE